MAAHLPGATLPVRQNRFTQPIAVLTATSKRAAAWLQDKAIRWACLLMLQRLVRPRID
jgi:hypothetical protein